METYPHNPIVKCGNSIALLGPGLEQIPDPQGLILSLNKDGKALEGLQNYVGFSKLIKKPFSIENSQGVDRLFGQNQLNENFIGQKVLESNKIFTVNQLEAELETKRMQKSPSMTLQEMKDRRRKFVVERMVHFAKFLTCSFQVGYNPVEGVTSEKPLITGFLFDINEWVRTPWRSLLSFLYDDVLAHNLQVTDVELRTKMPAWNFWYKLTLMFVGNDGPKYSAYSNMDLLALFFAMYDPLASTNLKLEVKWKLLQNLIEPVADLQGNFTLLKRIQQLTELLFKEKYPEIAEAFAQMPTDFIPCVPVLDFYPTACLGRDWTRLPDHEKRRLQLQSIFLSDPSNWAWPSKRRNKDPMEEDPRVKMGECLVRQVIPKLQPFLGWTDANSLEFTNNPYVLSTAYYQDWFTDQANNIRRQQVNNQLDRYAQPHNFNAYEALVPRLPAAIGQGRPDNKQIGYYLVNGRRCLVSDHPSERSRRFQNCWYSITEAPNSVAALQARFNEIFRPAGGTNYLERLMHLGWIVQGDPAAIVAIQTVPAAQQLLYLGYSFDCNDPFKVPHEMEKRLANSDYPHLCFRTHIQGENAFWMDRVDTIAGLEVLAVAAQVLALDPFQNWKYDKETHPYSLETIKVHSDYVVQNVANARAVGVANQWAYLMYIHEVSAARHEVSIRFKDFYSQEQALVLLRKLQEWWLCQTRAAELARLAGEAYVIYRSIYHRPPETREFPEETDWKSKALSLAKDKINWLYNDKIGALRTWYQGQVIALTSSAQKYQEAVQTEIDKRSSLDMITLLQENALYMKREMESTSFDDKYRVGDDQLWNEKVLTTLRASWLDSVCCYFGNESNRNILWACVYASPASLAFIPTQDQLLEMDQAANLYKDKAQFDGLILPSKVEMYAPVKALIQKFSTPPDEVKQYFSFAKNDKLSALNPVLNPDKKQVTSKWIPDPGTGLMREKTTFERVANMKSKEHTTDAIQRVCVNPVQIIKHVAVGTIYEEGENESTQSSNQQIFSGSQTHNPPSKKKRNRTRSKSTAGNLVISVAHNPQNQQTNVTRHPVMAQYHEESKSNAQVQNNPNGKKKRSRSQKKSQIPGQAALNFQPQPRLQNMIPQEPSSSNQQRIDLSQIIDQLRKQEQPSVVKSNPSTVKNKKQPANHELPHLVFKYAQENCKTLFPGAQAYKSWDILKGPGKNIVCALGLTYSQLRNLLGLKKYTPNLAGDGFLCTHSDWTTEWKIREGTPMTLGKIDSRAFLCRTLVWATEQQWTQAGVCSLVGNDSVSWGFDQNDWVAKFRTWVDNLPAKTAKYLHQHSKSAPKVDAALAYNQNNNQGGGHQPPGDSQPPNLKKRKNKKGNKRDNFEFFPKRNDGDDPDEDDHFGPGKGAKDFYSAFQNYTSQKATNQSSQNQGQQQNQSQKVNKRALLPTEVEEEELRNQHTAESDSKTNPKGKFQQSKAARVDELVHLQSQRILDSYAGQELDEFLKGAQPDPEGDEPVVVSKLDYSLLQKMAKDSYEKKCLALFKGHKDQNYGLDPLKYPQSWCQLHNASQKHIRKLWINSSLGDLQPETYNQIQKLLVAGIIEPVEKKDLKACCKVFTVFQGASKVWPYNQGDVTKHRLIYDARPINLFFAPPQGRLPHPYSPLARTEDKWFAALDLKNAFWNIKLSPEFSKWFGLECNGTYYKWKVMPFGWNMAPWLMTEAFNPVKRYLQSELLKIGLDVALRIYVDDLNISGKTKPQVEKALHFVLSTLDKLGFAVNHRKTIQPCEEIEWVGFKVRQGAIGLTEKFKKRLEEMHEDLKIRVHSTRQNTAQLPEKGNIPTYSVGDYLAFIGCLTFASRVCQGIRPKLHKITSQVPHKARVETSRHNDPMHLTPATLQNIQEIIKMIKNFDWFACSLHQTTMQVYTDASCSESKGPILGMHNGLLGSSEAGKTICPDKDETKLMKQFWRKSKNIAVLEALAVLVAVEQFPYQSRNLIVWCDSQVVESAFKRVDCENEHVSDIIQAIKDKAMKKNLAIVIRRVSTYFNFADAPSRAFTPFSQNKIYNAKYSDCYSMVAPEFTISTEEFHDTLNGKFYPQIGKLSEAISSISKTKQGAYNLKKHLKLITNNMDQVLGSNAVLVAEAFLDACYYINSFLKSKSAQQLLAILRSRGLISESAACAIADGRRAPDENAFGASDDEETQNQRSRRRERERRNRSIQSNIFRKMDEDSSSSSSDDNDVDQSKLPRSGMNKKQYKNPLFGLPSIFVQSYKHHSADKAKKKVTFVDSNSSNSKMYSSEDSPWSYSQQRDQFPRSWFGDKDKQSQDSATKQILISNEQLNQPPILPMKVALQVQQEPPFHQQIFRRQTSPRIESKIKPDKKSHSSSSSKPDSDQIPMMNNYQMNNARQVSYGSEVDYSVQTSEAGNAGAFQDEIVQTKGYVMGNMTPPEKTKDFRAQPLKKAQLVDEAEAIEMFKTWKEDITKPFQFEMPAQLMPMLGQFKPLRLLPDDVAQSYEEWQTLVEIPIQQHGEITQVAKMFEEYLYEETGQCLRVFGFTEMLDYENEESVYLFNLNTIHASKFADTPEDINEFRLQIMRKLNSFHEVWIQCQEDPKYKHLAEAIRDGLALNQLEVHQMNQLILQESANQNIIQSENSNSQLNQQQQIKEFDQQQQNYNNLINNNQNEVNRLQIFKNIDLEDSEAKIVQKTEIQHFFELGKKLHHEQIMNKSEIKSRIPPPLQTPFKQEELVPIQDEVFYEIIEQVPKHLHYGDEEMKIEEAPESKRRNLLAFNLQTEFGRYPAGQSLAPLHTNAKITENSFGGHSELKFGQTLQEYRQTRENERQFEMSTIGHHLLNLQIGEPQIAVKNEAAQITQITQREQSSGGQILLSPRPNTMLGLMDLNIQNEEEFDTASFESGSEERKEDPPKQESEELPLAIQATYYYPGDHPQSILLAVLMFWQKLKEEEDRKNKLREVAAAAYFFNFLSFFKSSENKPDNEKCGMTPQLFKQVDKLQLGVKFTRTDSKKQKFEVDSEIWNEMIAHKEAGETQKLIRLKFGNLKTQMEKEAKIDLSSSSYMSFGGLFGSITGRKDQSCNEIEVEKAKIKEVCWRVHEIILSRHQSTMRTIGVSEQQQDEFVDKATKAYENTLNKMITQFY